MKNLISTILIIALILGGLYFTNPDVDTCRSYYMEQLAEEDSEDSNNLFEDIKDHLSTAVISQQDYRFFSVFTVPGLDIRSLGFACKVFVEIPDGVWEKAEPLIEFLEVK